MARWVGKDVSSGGLIEHSGKASPEETVSPGAEGHAQKVLPA